MSTAKIIGSIVLLMLFDMSIHPLTLGPDRRIHDPAVYRLNNSEYMAGDWYTDMAVQSGVYIFYSKLVHIGPVIGVPEESWRLSLYILSLVILYYSILRIAWLFSKSMLVVPLIAGVHALMVIIAPPIWLYGPFIQIDGGLAPRSIGTALSFLALFFLLRNSIIIPSIILGVSTLVHVSNSLIVFTLFFAVWLCYSWIARVTPTRSYWFSILRKGLVGITCYIVTGGWFAFYVARLNSYSTITFPVTKFIWSWIYFRAPYMALPLMPWKSWLLFILHVLVICLVGYLLWKKSLVHNRTPLSMILLVSLGAVIYFFIFYLFAFIYPWLPGFQFYSIRVIYFLYFIAYLFMGLAATRWRIVCITVMGVGIAALVFFHRGNTLMAKVIPNLQTSIRYIEANQQTTPSATTRYLNIHSEPFLAPPHWYGSPYYLPSVASFKSFGFTPQGLEEWYERLNNVSDGELERTYALQQKSGIFRPVRFDWPKLYAKLTHEEVLSLSYKYNFRLFLTYQALSYPFPVIAEDGDYRLYQVR